LGKLTGTDARAENGNVVQTAKIAHPRKFTLVLSFGKNEKETADTASLSLKKGFQTSQAEYRREWRAFCNTLPKVGNQNQKQFNYAAMVLRASEDKTFRGGNVASLTNPWITGSVANGPYVGGYHLVWAAICIRSRLPILRSAISPRLTGRWTIYLQNSSGRTAAILR
jgi:glucoamylase